MGLERFTKDGICTIQGNKVITLCNAAAITDTLLHTYMLSAQGGLRAEEIRSYRQFKVTLYNTHNQNGTASIAFYCAAYEGWSNGYIETGNLSATAGALHLWSTAAAAGCAAVIKQVPSLADVHSDFYVGVQFSVAPASGALTIRVEMH